MIERILHDNWTMHRIGEKEWIPAVVPGSVYGDLLREGRMEDPFWKDNEDKALALMDDDYEYRAVFSCDIGMLASDEVLLQFDGLDTIADITLNGTTLGHADNMHRIWRYSVKENSSMPCARRSPVSASPARSSCAES